MKAGGPLRALVVVGRRSALRLERHRYVKFVGYTGLCPRVSQSGDVDLRGLVSKRAPRHLRWGLIEAAQHAISHELLRERYQRLKRRHGRLRGSKVAQIDLARQLAQAVW